jgi:hypothetical protein
MGTRSRNAIGKRDAEGYLRLPGDVQFANSVVCLMGWLPKSGGILSLSWLKTPKNVYLLVLQRASGFIEVGDVPDYSPMDLV